MTDQPTVAHLLRRYRSRTETFVGGQISSLERYRPVILCQRRTVERYEEAVPLHTAIAPLRGPELWLAEVAYSAARQLSSAAAAALADAARAEGTRLLHGHYVVDARYFVRLKRRLGVPLIVSAYGYDVSSFPRRMLGYGQRYVQPLWRAADLVLAMSEDMRRDLVRLGCPDGLVRVHYHGIRIDRFTTPSRTYRQPEVVNLLCCGTLEIKKGQHLVVEALRRLQASGADLPAWHLTLIGDGPMRGHLERTVRDLGWGTRVTFAGHIPHHEPRLVAAYHDADVFSLPSMTVRSDKEGIPGTIAEAMAAGLPVLSTRHAGIPELIEEDRSGLLVPEADVEGLAARLARLLIEPDLRARLGSAAVERVRRVGDLKSQTRRLEQIYDEVLGQSALSVDPQAANVRH